MKTYLFYDTETSGLNPAFDQVLTFACIRTDLGLKEIDRQIITIRLRKDIVPSPKAFLTHGLTCSELESGITEYEAAIKIHGLMNTPGTISLGYNSLGFDDEFLRFLFYRNLLDPYTHQYGNGCSRMDILPIAVVYRNFHPDCLRWPYVDGKPSLKLELIASENNFVTSGRAHEAMSDVEALIALSKKMFQQTKIWKYCLDFFNKTRDQVRISSIQRTLSVENRSFKVGLMLSVSFGSKIDFMAPVVLIGESIPYKNQSLWLRLDSDDILGLDSAIELKDTFVIRKRPADNLIVLPALERFWEKLPSSSKKSTEQNIEKLCLHGDKFFKFIDYHIAYQYPRIPDVDIDAALYQDGFFSAHEKKDIKRFHKNLNHHEPDPLNEIKAPRIKKMASRILARNFEKREVKSENEDYQRCLERLRSFSEKDQIVGYKNDTKYNRKQGLQDVKQLQEDLNPAPDQRKMLEWLKNYIAAV